MSTIDTKLSTSEKLIEKLKPCPFCGGEAELFCDKSGFVYQVGCLTCGATGRNGNSLVAKTQWNTRAEDPRIKELEDTNRTLHSLMRSGEKRGVDKATEEYEQRINELEAALDHQKDEYEGLIDVAESNYKELESAFADRVRIIELQLKDKQELQAQLEENVLHTALQVANIQVEELEAQLDEANQRADCKAAKDGWLKTAETQLARAKKAEAQLDKVRGQVIELRTREFVLEKHLVEATDECPKCYAGIIISNGFLVCPECDWTEEKQAALSTGER